MENTTELFFEFDEDTNSYTVIGKMSEDVTEIVIPDTYDGLPVTKIADYAFEEDSDCVERIVLGGNVEVVGEDAFRWCYELKSITFGSSVKHIGDNALPLKSMDINYLGTIEDWCGISYGFSEAGKEIALYINGEILKNAVIPSTVKEINNCAFDGCKYLESVTIENGVTKIGQYAFFNCTSLKRIIIPISVETMGERVFDGCSFIEIFMETEDFEPKNWDSSWCDADDEKLIFGYNGKDVGTTQDGIKYAETKSGIAIYGDIKDENASLPTMINGKEVTTLAGVELESIKHLDIPSNISILSKLGISCSSLESVYIHRGVKKVGRCAFFGCDSLSTIYCEADERPDDWDEQWNCYSEARVIWGYKK